MGEVGLAGPVPRLPEGLVLLRRPLPFLPRRRVRPRQQGRQDEGRGGHKESKEEQEGGFQVQKEGKALEETEEERAFDEHIRKEVLLLEWQKCTTQSGKLVVRSSATGVVRFSPPTPEEVLEEQNKFKDLKKAYVLQKQGFAAKAAEIAARHSVAAQDLEKD